MKCSAYRVGCDAKLYVIRRDDGLFGTVLRDDEDFTVGNLVNDELPPRKTFEEAQRDLDTFALEADLRKCEP